MQGQALADGQTERRGAAGEESFGKFFSFDQVRYQKGRQQRGAGAARAVGQVGQQARRQGARQPASSGSFGRTGPPVNIERCEAEQQERVFGVEVILEFPEHRAQPAQPRGQQGPPGTQPGTEKQEKKIEESGEGQHGRRLHGLQVQPGYFINSGQQQREDRRVSDRPRNLVSRVQDIAGIGVRAPAGQVHGVQDVLGVIVHPRLPLPQRQQVEDADPRRQIFSGDAA